MNITESNFKELKLSYNKALADGKDSFLFEGREILVSYAKYLIEYLETKFTMTPK